jgi:DNA-binding Lrp family transcriptional regulator
MEPILAIIDVDVHANKDEAAREQILANLAADQAQGSAVVLLWINWLRARADMRLVCLVRNLRAFDDFIIDVIRSVPGVRSTSARLTLDGLVHSELVEALPLQDSVWTRRASATVEINVEAGHERAVYVALGALPKHDEVEVGYVMKCLHGGTCDMIVLLLGPRTEALSGYVNGRIRTIPGVSDTLLFSMLDWKVMARTEDLLTLVQCFPDPQGLARIEARPDA